MYPIRINKFLTMANFCSRREADRLIEAERVKINNRFAVLGDQVSADDRIFVDGKEIKLSQKEKIYLALNKPVGVITTTDTQAKDNIIEAVNYPERIFPIGRLDVKTSGLILLTNDGAIVNKILKGQNKIEKEYMVEVDKHLTPEFLKKLETGIKIDGYPTLPAKTKKLGDRKFSIIIVEGKNRQIRRMCERLGLNVARLQRIRIGTIKLDDLKTSQYRPISAKEIELLIGRQRKENHRSI